MTEKKMLKKEKYEAAQELIVGIEAITKLIAKYLKLTRRKK